MTKNATSTSLDASCVSRRGAVKWAAALTASGATLGAAGCSGFDRGSAGTADPESQGEWIPCNCWADCGSKGFNKVLVKDGEAVRMGTDKTHADSPDCPQLRSCARGRALRGMVFGADRIKYPMKRKGWQPGGKNFHGELRGRDEWERISWEEAYRYIADESIRIQDTYGLDSVFIPGYVASLFGNWDIGRLFALRGGYLEHWGACSSGAWGSLAKVYGLAEDTNDRIDLRNADLIVLWGSNPAWSRTGLPTYDYLQCKNANTKFIVIDIFRHATAQALSAEYVGIRPGTDTALALGMAYVLLTEDDPDSNPLIDWDFLNRCTVGFDADHMPDDATTSENFKDYVLGAYDGTPKTPEWAAEICGVNPKAIERLALEIAKTEKVSIIMSPAPSRTTNGMTWCQAIMTLGAMSGCIGKPGCCCGSDAGHSWLQGGYLTLLQGGTILGEPSWTTSGQYDMIWNPIGGASIEYGVPNGMYKQPEEPNYRININEVWTGILDGEFTVGNGKKKPCNVQMIYDTHENILNQAPGTMLGIEAYRKVEFVVAQNIVMTTACKYADIVLPVTTQWERYGDFTAGYREQMLWTSQVCEPLFEAKSDLDIAAELAEYMGVDPEQVRPLDYKQMVFNWVAAATRTKKDGSGLENLVSITQEDLDTLGVKGMPQEGAVPILDLKRNGIYTYERTQDDGLDHVVLKAFRDDPEANPIGTTTSGKLEIYCQQAVDRVKACGWSEIPPIPKYMPAIEGYEETFADWSSKEKGDYPFQLVTVHITRHSHSSFANVPTLREAIDHPLYMNPIDAEAKGFKTNDTVLVTSRWGKVLRPVLLTEIMMPGVVALGQGAWAEIDEETGVDLAGCTNVLCGPNAVGCGHQAWNSCIVNVEKWTGTPLAPDYAWEPREVFKEN